jgi:hypothetical protein
MPVASDHLLLDDYRIVKSSRPETPEAPATKWALQAIAETENNLRVVAGLFEQAVAKQPDSFRN